MGEAATQPWVDYATYLQIERDTNQRHEWFDGRVYAMAGGTLEHSALAGNTLIELGALARACGCQVHTSDAKIRVLATGLSTYSDGAVVCGLVERDPNDRHAMTNPVVIVEVLSDGTEGYDRGEKFHHYRQVASLRDYVLVSQYEARVEVYSRDPAGRWVLSVAGRGESIALTGLDGAIEVDRIYQGVSLAALSPLARGPSR